MLLCKITPESIALLYIRIGACPGSVTLHPFLASALCPLKWTLQNVIKSIVCFLVLSTFVDSGRKVSLRHIRVQRHAADFAALYLTLLYKYCEEISRKNEQVTSKLDQGWSAPRSQPPRPRCAVLCTAVWADISRALSSLCGLRAHFTFLPCEAKTFHFCAAVYVRLPLTYICAKISRPQPPNIACAYFGCSAAQDIKGWSAPATCVIIYINYYFFFLLDNNIP